MQEAEIADKEASAAQKKAAAGNPRRVTREKMKAALATDNVGTLKGSARGRPDHAAGPGAAPVADNTVAREAGFIGATEKHDAQ